MDRRVVSHLMIPFLPSDGWASACSMAVLMAKHIHPDKEVEFVSCAEYEAEEYADIGYVYDAPVVLQ